MKKRRWICLALTAALTFGMLAGCGQMKDLSDGGEKKELQKVTLNEVAHSIFYAPMYVAIEEGYFREEGIDLTLCQLCEIDQIILGSAVFCIYR